LLTGGSGFLGRHLYDELIRKGADVLAISRHSGPCPTDLRDRAGLSRVLGGENFDYVFNVAGVIDQSVRAGIYAEQFEVHVSATLNIVESIRMDRLVRFVHIGSNAEYGSAPCPQYPEGPVKPNSAYGVSKLAASSLLLAKAHSEGLPVVVVRPFLIYGSGQSPRSFLAAAIEAARGGSEFPTTPGAQTRDMVYVKKVVSDIVDAAVDVSCLGRAVNSCTGQPITIREVLELLASICPGFRPKFGAVAYRSTELMESSGIPYRACSARAARDELRKFLMNEVAR
jgi:nucleoside-diphosphate-sugar epimerase